MAEGVNVSGYYCTCDRCEGDDYFYEEDEPVDERCWCGDPDCDGSYFERPYDESKIVDSGPIDMRPVENNNGN